VGPDETNGSVTCGVSASRSDGVGELFPREMQKADLARLNGLKTSWGQIGSQWNSVVGP
jgi:hypothetical protein